MTIVSSSRLAEADSIGTNAYLAPRLLVPDPRTLFKQQAKRLAFLAEEHELRNWLRFCHDLSLAQQRLVGSLLELEAQTDVLPASEPIADAITPPPLAISGVNEVVGSPVSFAYWQRLLADMLQHEPTPAQREVLQSLQTWSQAQWQTQAQVLLTSEGEFDTAEAVPFLAAALQVEWVERASQLPRAFLQSYSGESSLCPVCGSHPMVSLIHTGEPNHGVRYLVCSLCYSQWYATRAKCTNCDAIEAVALLGASEKVSIQGECCDSCHGYVKVLSLPRDIQLDPCADDLATLGLDMMLEQAGYGRAARNLLLVGLE